MQNTLLSNKPSLLCHDFVLVGELSVKIEAVKQNNNTGRNAKKVINYKLYLGNSQEIVYAYTV